MLVIEIDIEKEDLVNTDSILASEVLLTIVRKLETFCYIKNKIKISFDTFLKEMLETDKYSYKPYIHQFLKISVIHGT